MSDSLEHLRTGPAKAIAQLVERSPDLSNQELRAALSNALMRISDIERQWELLNRVFQRFDEQFPNNVPSGESPR